MNREDEGALFRGALHGLSYDEVNEFTECWADDIIVIHKGVECIKVHASLFVLRPAGTTFRKSAVAVIAQQGAPLPVDWVSVQYTGCWCLAIYRGGTDVLEVTGAANVLRTKLEGKVLRGEC